MKRASSNVSASAVMLVAALMHAAGHTQSAQGQVIAWGQCNSCTASSQCCPEGWDNCRCMELTVDICPSDSQCVASCAAVRWAFTNALWLPSECDPDPCWCPGTGAGEADSNTSDCETEAHGEFLGEEENRWSFELWANAKTSNPGCGGSPEIDLQGSICHWECWTDHGPFGAAATVAGAFYSLATSGCDTTFTVSGSMADEGLLGGSRNRRCRGYLIRLDCGGTIASAYGYLCVSPGGQAAVNLTLISGKWIWTPTISACNNGSTIRPILFDFSDDDLDVDGDGRFNEEDTSALYLLEGSNDPDLLRSWDFDEDNEIDADDTACLQELVDAGLSAGLLGDHNQDGVVDCRDTDGTIGVAPSYFHTTHDMGGAQYQIELDADLDGDIDGDDKTAVYWATCRADFNMDGVVNTQDFLAFGNAWAASDPSADSNGDGTVNTQGYIQFLGLHAAGGC